MASLTFSKSLVERLKESLETALRLSNIHLYRLAQAGTGLRLFNKNNNS